MKKLIVNRCRIGAALLITAICCATATSQNIQYVGSTLWTGIRDSKAVGDYIYGACGNGLIIVSIADPTSPILAGRVLCSGNGYGIDVVDDFAYIADMSSLQIIEVSDTAMPRWKSSYPLDDGVNNVVVKGNYTYIAGGSNGLVILDVSNPANPTLVNSLDQIYAWDIYINGNYAYITDVFVFGLWIVDISDPENLTIVSTYTPYAWDYGIYVYDGYAYIAHELGLEIVDVSNPYAPTFTSVIHTESNAYDVIVCDNYAYLADDTSGLMIIDVSNKVNPVLVGNYRTTGNNRSVFMNDQFAYLTDGDGLYIVDVDSPATPTLTGKYDMTGMPIDLVLSGDYCYLAVDGSGLQSININNPSNPTIIDSYGPLGRARELDKQGNYVYLADGDSGVHIIDVSNPEHLTLLGTCHAPLSAASISVRGDYAYISDEATGLKVINISQPTNPYLVSQYNITESNSLDLEVLGDYVFVAIRGMPSGGRFLILNVDNPLNPQYAAEIATSGLTICIAVDSNYAYLGESSGIQIFDISDKTNPFWVGEYTGAYHPRDMYLGGNYLYAVEHTIGLQVLDISNPSDLRLVGSYDLPGSGMGIAVAGEYIYTANCYSMMVFRLTPFNIDEVISISSDYSLEQNYPNPFNLSTTLNYTVAQVGPVSLAIFNTLGQKMATLVDQIQQAGQYNLIWNAAPCPSGVYFAKLTTPNNFSGIKLTLIK
jgi:hypothetical protein